MPSSSRAPLGRNRDFRLFWAGQTISAFGDAFAFVAMPLLVLEVTGSVQQMGLVTATAGVAQVATGLVSGIVMDRVHRRRLMIACDLLRLALYLTLPVAWWLGHRSLWLVYVVSALGAAFGNLFWVGYVAAIPNVVELDELGRANGSLQASQALVYVLGPLAAGALATRLGVATTLVFDAASFGISALTLSLVRFRREGGAEREGRDARGEAENRPAGLSPGGLLAGVRFLLRQRVLRTALALVAVVSFLGSAGLSATVIDLFIFRLRQELGQSSRAVGACLGAAAIGAVVGAVGAPRLLRARRDDGADGSGGGGGAHGGGGGVLLGTGIQALGLLVAASVRGVGTTAFGAGLWAMGLTVRAVPYQSLRQALTPDPLLGRVTAASMTITFAAASAGAPIVTRLAAAFGAARTLVGLAWALAAVVAVGLFTPLGRLRTRAGCSSSRSTAV
jgi:MFS family permease